MSAEEITANERAADLARFAAEEYARLAAPGHLRELADPDVFEWLARDLITDLCHLADAVAVPGDRETWTLCAHRRYREEADRANRDPDAAQ